MPIAEAIREASKNFNLIALIHVRINCTFLRRGVSYMLLRSVSSAGFFQFVSPPKLTRAAFTYLDKDLYREGISIIG
jgi:hypothetical protein